MLHHVLYKTVLYHSCLTMKGAVDYVSPYILELLLVAEILGIMIRTNSALKAITLNNTEHKIGQHADDTELFLGGCEKKLWGRK